MKKLGALPLALLMVLSLSVFVFVASPSSPSCSIALDAEPRVTVVVPAEFETQFGSAELEAITANNTLSDGDVITVHDVKELSLPHTGIPFGGESSTYRPIVNRGPEQKGQDYFVVSAAKGVTITASTLCSSTTNPFIMAAEIFGAGYELVGPPETSPHNSREYRVQFYVQAAGSPQEQTDRPGTVDTADGQVEVLTLCTLYSIDRTL